MTFENLFYLMGNAFRIYAILRFVKSFFDYDKTKNKIVLMAFSGFYIINSACFLLAANPLINLITNVVPLFLITLLFDSKLISKVAIALSVYAINMFGDAIVFAVSKAFNIETILISSGIITALTVFALELLWEHWKRFKYTEAIRHSHLLALFFVPFCCIAIGTLTIQKANSRTVVISALLLIINVMVFYLYDNIVKSYTDMHEKSILDQQNKAYINQLKLVYDSQKTIQFYRHDMRNHLYKMRDMVEHEQFAKLKEYIGQTSKYMKLDKKIIESGNTDIDCLLNYKLRNVDEMNIELDTKVVLPHELFINVFDINIILGNLLDNALEALKQCSERRLIVHLTYSKGVMFITIKNTFVNNINMDSSGKIPSTTKKDMNKHGLGLQSVQYTLDKYDGTMEIETIENIFSVKALMYNK